MRGAIAKLAAAVLTALIIAMLVIMGPANAFNIKFTITDKAPSVGDPIRFLARLTTNVGEFVKINYLTFNITGPSNVSCKFLPNTTIISGCQNMTLTILDDSGFGYGYGYGYGTGTLDYKIILDSSGLNPGDYKTQFVAFTDTNKSINQKGSFALHGFSNLVDGCSLRGKNGNVSYDDFKFGKNNKINLNIPLKRATDGQGSFESQSKDRISFKFDINKAVKNGTIVTIDVFGTFRSPSRNITTEKATIIFDKANRTLSLTSSTFQVYYMKVDFVKGC